MNHRNISVLSYANGFTLWHYRADTARLPPDHFNGFAHASSGDMVLISASDGGAQIYLERVEPGNVEFSYMSIVLIAEQ